MTTGKPLGSVIGFDISVPDADGLRDFYRAVIGWGCTGLDMGDYEDYFMTVSPGNETVAGICHARGINADLPPVWLAYVSVPDIDAAIVAVRANGGETVTPVKGDPGSWRYCVIRDPAGAHIALMQAGA